MKEMKKLIIIAIAVVGLALSSNSNLRAQSETSSSVVTCPPGYICVPTGGGSSAPVPDYIPLVSEATLKAYALTLVNQIQGNLWSPSMSGTTYFSVAYTNHDADPNKMAQLASSQTMSVTFDQAERASAGLNYYAAMNYSGYGSMWHQLFYCYTNFFFENVGGVWKVPAAAYTNVLQMGDYIPFPMGKAISYAYMELENENGDQIGSYEFRQNEGRINADIGLLYLGKEQTAQTGKLYVNFRDGTKAIYDLRGGNQRPTVTSTVHGLIATIDGVRSLPDNTTNVVFKVGDEIVRGKYTTVSVVSVTFPPGHTKYPIGVYVVDAAAFAADPTMAWEFWNPFQAEVRFSTQANQTVLIRFEYAPSPDKLENYNYYGGGGKG